jgi:hypothetical protein
MALTGCLGGEITGKRPSGGEPAGGDDIGWPVADAGVDSGVPSTPDAGNPGGYSPTTPHWSHIRTEVTDFRIRHIPEDQKEPEYDWTAAHYDVVMDGPSRPFKIRNPTLRTAPYQLALAFQQTDQGAPDITAMQVWYADPATNTAGDAFEDAFLHTALIWRLSV